MFFSDGQEDPLGLAVKGRAREKRIADSLQGLNHVGGPLVDPNWDGFFQAAQEQGGGKQPRFGYATQPADDLSRDPEAVASQMYAMPMAAPHPYTPSSQLGTPYDSSLVGLRKAISASLAKRSL